MQDRYAVIGFPIKHSRSPFIHDLFAKQTDQNIQYELIEATSDEFLDKVKIFVDEGGRGLNITVPHKQTIVSIADQCSEIVKLTMAANTLIIDAGKNILAHNTDGIGLVNDLQKNHGIGLQGKNILLIGAGGAARGVIANLLGCDPESITITNRTFSKAQQLVESYGESEKLIALENEQLRQNEYHVMINATSASLANKVPNVSPSVMHDELICYDMVYTKKPTKFLQWAKEMGSHWLIDGKGMLVEQAAESFFLWRGVRPDTAPVIKALNKLLS